MAHCRPQPAIPAVLVLLLTFMLATAVGRDAAAGGWLPWLIPLGVVGSAALAVAAGFCSLFPQFVWLVLIAAALPRLSVPAFTPYVVYVAMFAVVCMVGIQLWRIVTRRFVPTVSLDD